VGHEVEVAINDRTRVARASTPSRGLAEHVRTVGCPRCGSTCASLDDCPVCRGEVVCARCLFGVRVDADEIHAAFVPEG